MPSIQVLDSRNHDLEILQDQLSQAQTRYTQQLYTGNLKVAYVVVSGTRKVITIAKATHLERARLSVDYVVYVSDVHFQGLPPSVQAYLLFTALYRTFGMDGALLPVNQANLELAKLFGVDPILYPTPDLLESLPNLLETPLGEVA